ncbi:MAG: CocE/NonD family hydrolase C-terminal non-catalytic domain-containing protein [Breoghania sp.]|nr:CocE/NonD family hydrolase C-terminal non-catalytic domain-containing protein [Breoghania sp.]MDJ0932303.1 CocE/NonD family hydrolase C-terminal non-catalytic domain-containing protein [Breoghania sp.]
MTRRFVFGEHGTMTEADTADIAPLTIQSPLTLVICAGKWCSYAAGPDLAHGQRQEDGGALVFETGPLVAPLEMLGGPEVELELASDRPVAMVAVRLSNIAPDDKTTRITYDLLNLTHRTSDEMPEALTPGEFYRVGVRLNDAAQSFPTDHRIRVSLSTSYWPLAWPSPSPVRLTVRAGVNFLTLPERTPRADDAYLRAFEAPEGAAPAPRRHVEPGHHN